MSLAEFFNGAAYSVDTKGAFRKESALFLSLKFRMLEFLSLPSYNEEFFVCICRCSGNAYLCVSL